MNIPRQYLILGVFAVVVLGFFTILFASQSQLKEVKSLDTSPTPTPLPSGTPQDQLKAYFKESEIVDLYLLNPTTYVDSVHYIRVMYPRSWRASVSDSKNREERKYKYRTITLRKKSATLFIDVEDVGGRQESSNGSGQIVEKENIGNYSLVQAKISPIIRQPIERYPEKSEQFITWTFPDLKNTPNIAENAQNYIPFNFHDTLKIKEKFIHIYAHFPSNYDTEKNKEEYKQLTKEMDTIITNIEL